MGLVNRRRQSDGRGSMTRPQCPTCKGYTFLFSFSCPDVYRCEPCKVDWIDIAPTEPYNEHTPIGHICKLVPKP